MKARLLLTSVGGLVAPGIIGSLKKEKGHEFFIVGVDSKPDVVGFHYVDRSYVVPQGKGSDYFKSIFNICRKEKIDVLIPLSDDEMLSISRNQKELRSIGTRPLCSSFEAVETAVDKGRMLNYLKEKGFNVPEFYVVNDLKELDRVVRLLRHAKKNIILKPCVGSGARGFWRLTRGEDNSDLLWNDRSRQSISYKNFRDLAGKTDRFPRSVVMEFLDGTDYNIDVLTLKGETLAICPMERIIPDAGPIQVGHIKKNKILESKVRAIVKKFNFSYNINIEMACRKNEGKQIPLIYEINPRASAAVAVSAMAGSNLLLAAILLSLDKNIKINEFKDIRFQRFYQEICY